MGQVIGQFFLAILESLAELFCFFTGKWLLRLIAGGRVVPMPPTIHEVGVSRHSNDCRPDRLALTLSLWRSSLWYFGS